MIRWVAVVVVLLAGVFGWMQWMQSQESLLPEEIVFGNGRIEAVQVDVACKFAGRIERVLTKEGDLVTAGQTIARMDTLQLDASLAQAKAQ
ncbi:MAG: biotin/lipoyl-binding protein, partial [Planctomycetota bacterium]